MWSWTAMFLHIVMEVSISVLHISYSSCRHLRRIGNNMMVDKSFINSFKHILIRSFIISAFICEYAFTYEYAFMEYFISYIYLCVNLLCSVTGAIVLYDFDTTVFFPSGWDSRRKREACQSGGKGWWGWQGNYNIPLHAMRWWHMTK